MDEDNSPQDVLRDQCAFSLVPFVVFGMLRYFSNTVLGLKGTSRSCLFLEKDIAAQGKNGKTETTSCRSFGQAFEALQEDEEYRGLRGAFTSGTMDFLQSRFLARRQELEDLLVEEQYASGIDEVLSWEEEVSNAALVVVGGGLVHHDMIYGGLYDEVDRRKFSLHISSSPHVIMCMLIHLVRY